MENLTISQKVLESMNKRNAMRRDTYRLHKNFVGDYRDAIVKPIKAREGEEEGEEVSFSVSASSNSGNHTLSGFQIINARILPGDVNLPLEGGLKDQSIFYDDVIETELMKAQRWHEIMVGDEDYKMPTEFEVVGAMVFHDTDGGDHPRIPFTRYDKYSVLLRHHKLKTENPKARFVSYNDIQNYLSDKDNLPTGIDKNYKFEVKDKSLLQDMSMWNFELVIKLK